MPEREVVACSADDGQQAETAVQSSHLISLGLTWFFVHARRALNFVYF